MKHVVMIGPSLTSKGGMATVNKNLVEHGYEADGRCRFLPTHVEGSALKKAACALTSFVIFLGMLVTGRVALLHVHVASGVSFWRKAFFIGAAQLFGRPVLFHLHGGHFIEFVDQELSGWRQRLARGLIGRSKAALALSRESADWLHRACGIKTVEVFPNPMNLAPPPSQPLVRNRDIVYMARIDPIKGVFDLIKAFVAVAAAEPQARVIICGKGDLAPVRALADTLGLGENVVLEGWVGPERRNELLQRSAVFCLPSYEEQMPMAVLEALAAGTPVVASNAGAIPEILEYGRLGVIVPMGDIGKLSQELLRMMNDQEQAEAFARRGIEQIKSVYRIDAVLGRLRQRYEDLAA